MATEDVDSDEIILLELNKMILNLNYTFKVNAPLKNYIRLKTNSMRENYTLAELLTILKNVSMSLTYLMKSVSPSLNISINS